MQIVNEGNWIDRSLSYLCRSYDSLYRGQKYTQALPVLHIGFLDYTLFKDAPEFYATYKMMNVKTHQLYSDKLRVGVVDLSHIELATDEDKLYGIDHWASLFKAGTWEEAKYRQLLGAYPVISLSFANACKLSKSIYNNMIWTVIFAEPYHFNHETSHPVKPDFLSNCYICFSLLHMSLSL